MYKVLYETQDRFFLTIEKLFTHAKTTQTSIITNQYYRYTFIKYNFFALPHVSETNIVTVDIK